MKQNRERVARAGASLLVLLTGFVAFPLLLIGMSTSRFGSAFPLAGVRSPWTWSLADIETGLREPLDDSTVTDLVLRVALTVAWAGLLVCAVTVIVEVVHQARHRGIPTPHVRGVGWAQGIARWVVAGLFMLPLVTPASTRAAALDRIAPIEPPAAQVLDIGFVDPADMAMFATPSPAVGSAVATRTAAPSTTHVVQRGDSVFGIASDLVGGDAERTFEVAHLILDENLGRQMVDGQTFTNPAYIEVGWELRLPAEVSGLARPETPPRSDDLETTEYVVTRGDTLSSIAADTLGDADSWPAIWEATAGQVMGDGRVFDDPNLIVPGWTLRVPTPVAEPGVNPPDRDEHEARPDVEPDPDDSPAEIDREAPAVSSPPSESEAAQPDRAAPAIPSPARTTAPTTAPSHQPAPTSPATTPAPAAEPAPPQRLPDLSPSPTLRLEHAALAAAGVLAALAARRQRRLRAARSNVRVPLPAPETMQVERRLRQNAAAERGVRLDVAVRAVAAHSLDASGAPDSTPPRDPVAELARVAIVAVSGRGDVTIHLTSPLELPAPWVGSNREWRIPAGVAIEMLAPAARRVGDPCHALVPVGVDEDGAEILVDLEAAGTLSLAAPEPFGSEVVRAIGLGLATSERAEAAHLVAVGLPGMADVAHPNAHLADTADAAVELAMDLAGPTGAETRSSFELRARRTGGAIWEPAVLLLDGAVDWPLAGVPDPVGVPGRGIAVVHVVDDLASDTHDLDSCRIEWADTGWRFVGFGLVVPLTPIGLTAGELRSVGGLFTDAARLEPDDLPALPGTHHESFAEAPPGIHHESFAEAPPGMHPEPFAEAPHEIIVRLFSGLDVVDRDGARAEFNRSKSAELVAWLTTHRDRSTRTAARTALWEQDVRDATFANVVSEARRTLARLVEPTADEWLGRTLTEELPLDARVTTDAELIRARLAHVRGGAGADDLDDGAVVEVLRPVLDLITDAPFAGTDYLWPDAEGITSNLVLLAVDACTELANRALSQGDIGLVFEATDRGLRVLPGHEEMIELRMRARAGAHDLAGLRQEWQAYERAILADPWSDGEPAPRLCALRAELLSANTPA